MLPRCGSLRGVCTASRSGLKEGLAAEKDPRAACGFRGESILGQGDEEGVRQVGKRRMLRLPHGFAARVWKSMFGDEVESIVEVLVLVGSFSHGNEGQVGKALECDQEQHDDDACALCGAERCQGIVSPGNPTHRRRRFRVAGSSPFREGAGILSVASS